MKTREKIEAVALAIVVSIFTMASLWLSCVLQG